MKALTLIQPWASLVILGAKRFETRSWKTPYRGPLLIHASKAMPKAARELCGAEPYRSALQEFSTSVEGGMEFTFDIGVVLGAVEVVKVWTTECIVEGHDYWTDGQTQIVPAKERQFGDFRAGRWAWELRVLHRLATPIPWRGSLGLWDFPDANLPAELQPLSNCVKLSD